MKQFLLILGAVLLGWGALGLATNWKSFLPVPDVPDLPKLPVLPNKPCPPRPPRPWGDHLQIPVGVPHVGGPSDGNVEVTCDLPLTLRKKNVGGRDGQGLCVFTSIMHAARYQNERRLWNFQDQMRQERGGGWPSKTDQMIAKYGPGTSYVQYEGRDPAVLEKALATGRMPSVTYCGQDPTYRGGTVAHMVNLVHLDATVAAILDNNRISPDEASIMWMTRAEFLSRWIGNQSGWAVILLAPSPPPSPRLP